MGERSLTGLLAERLDMRYSAACSRCDLQVGVDNQEALDEMIERLDGGEACTSPLGHDLSQVFPP